MIWIFELVLLLIGVFILVSGAIQYLIVGYCAFLALVLFVVIISKITQKFLINK